jgi:hypothetical protein
MILGVSLIGLVLSLLPCCRLSDRTQLGIRHTPRTSSDDTDETLPKTAASR